jgi:hypothetical protein
VRVIGYVRVSTEEQAISGLGLEAQRSALREAWKHREGRLVTVLSDEGYSGKDLDRPGLNRGAPADRRWQGRCARRREARPPDAQQLGPRRADRVVPVRARRPDRARLRRPRHDEGVGPDDRDGDRRGRAVGARLDGRAHEGSARRPPCSRQAHRPASGRGHPRAGGPDQGDAQDHDAPGDRGQAERRGRADDPRRLAVAAQQRATACGYKRRPPRRKPPDLPDPRRR